MRNIYTDWNGRTHSAEDLLTKSKDEAELERMYAQNIMVFDLNDDKFKPVLKDLKENLIETTKNAQSNLTKSMPLQDLC